MSAATTEEIAALEAHIAALRAQLGAPPPDAAPAAAYDAPGGNLGHALGRGKLGRFVGGAGMAASVPFLFGPAAPVALGALGIFYMVRLSGTAKRAQAVQDAAPGITAQEARAGASQGGAKRTVGGGLAALGAGGVGYALLTSVGIASGGFLIPAAAVVMGGLGWVKGRQQQHESIAARQEPGSAQSSDQIKQALGKGSATRTVGTALLFATPFLGLPALVGGLALRSIGKSPRTHDLKNAGMSRHQARRDARKGGVRRTVGKALIVTSPLLAATGVGMIVTAGAGYLIDRSGRNAQQNAAERRVRKNAGFQAGAQEAPAPQAGSPAPQPPPAAPSAAPRHGAPTRVTGARPQARAAAWGLRQPGGPPPSRMRTAA